MAHLKFFILWRARFSSQKKKSKFSLYSFHVIHDYLIIRRQTRGFYLLIVDKGRRPKSTIKVDRAPINDTWARVIKTITSCVIVKRAIGMKLIRGIQTYPLHLVFYSIFEQFVLFLLCTMKRLKITMRCKYFSKVQRESWQSAIKVLKCHNGTKVPCKVTKVPSQVTKVPQGTLEMCH